MVVASNSHPPEPSQLATDAGHPSINRRADSSPNDSESSTTSSNDSPDEFDWDKDDEGASKIGEPVKAKRGRRLWLAFMKLSRPIRVLLVACIGVSILIIPLIVVNVRFHGNAAMMHTHVWSLWFTINWATSCGTYLLVDSVPHLVIALTTLFGGRVEQLKIQIELLMAVKLWLKISLDITWAWVALSVLRAVYHPPGSYWNTINQIMQAFFASGIIILVEKLFLHFVAINFHQKALADRLAENRLGLRALDHLSNANPVSAKKSPYGKSIKHQPGYTGSFDLFSGIGHKPVSSLDSTATAPVASSSRSFFSSGRRRRAKRVANVIVDQVGEAIGQVALKDSKFNKEVDLGGLHSARRLARKLFSALSDVEPPRSHLIVEDFHPYFRTTAEAHEAFALFDKDGNGDISKKEMREAVQRIYRERKAMVASLKDVSSIVAKLDAVLLALAILIIIFICLLIFKRDNSISSLVPLATIVLGFSFIFGNSAQTLFESLIFIFSTHVFDVGDLVMIDDQILFVKEFGLFATTFRRVDGQEIIAPNSLLSSTKLVHNLRRSRSMWESTNLMVSYATPIELIEQLKEKIGVYIAANNREWSGFALNIDKMEYQNALHLVVAVEHRPNWQDWGGRWTRRNGFMRYLKTVLEELDLRYTMPVQPVLLPSSNGRPPVPPIPMPETRFEGHTGDIGNAGFFDSGGVGRVAGPSFPPGVPSFR